MFKVKINPFHINQRALLTALTAGAFGILTTGCLPIGKFPTAQYSTNRYTPNADGSGFTGTWILTFNNEITSDIEIGAAIYQRELVRIKPVDGATNDYDVTYCDESPAIAHATATVSGNTITLPTPGSILNGGVTTSNDYASTSNGRLVSIVPVEGGAIVRRAVRISSNPDLDAGSVGLHFATDNTDARQPTICFGENLIVGPEISDETSASNYTLRAVGASASGIVSGKLDEQPIGLVSVLTGSDGAGHQLNGPIIDNKNTSVTTPQGVTGSLVTQDNTDPSNDGSLLLEIKF